MERSSENALSNRDTLPLITNSGQKADSCFVGGVYPWDGISVFSVFL